MEPNKIQVTVESKQVQDIRHKINNNNKRYDININNNKRYDINIEDSTLRTFHILFNQFREQRISHDRLNKINKIVSNIKNGL
jgi:hypothetical protein